MHASSIQPATIADDRATTFTAVDGTGEHYDGYTLLVEAYAAIWLILMAWLLLLWRKQAGLTARITGLEAAIARAERRAASPSEPTREPAAAREAEAETSA